MPVEKVTIIGAGPAGVACALQLRRYDIKALLLEKASIGGLLQNANLVENYPGFPEGLPGTKLVALIRRQMARAGVQVVFDEVACLDWQNGLFQIKTHTTSYQTQICVVASGTKPRHFSELTIPYELQDRVYYEVHPLQQISGEQIVIVGGGDAAFDYALNLSQRNVVHILNRDDASRCLPILWQRVQDIPQIRYKTKTIITHISPASSGGMVVECASPEGTFSIKTSYLVGALGRQPQLDFLSDNLKEKSGLLSDQGLLYFIGDVKNDIYRQTAIAIGDGIMAAMKISTMRMRERK